MNAASGLAATGCSARTESASDPYWRQRDTAATVSWPSSSSTMIRSRLSSRWLISITVIACHPSNPDDGCPK
jgi:hypothetical protein